MEKESCNCFTCRHRDEPRVVAGYLQGYIDASDWFINWAEKNKIKMGSIADDDLGGIYAQMKCNRDESGCLLEEFPDLEKPIENPETENQRLKEQNASLQSELDKIIRENRKLVKVLKKYADEKNWIENDRHTGFITNSITGDKLYDEDYARIILESIGEL